MNELRRRGFGPGSWPRILSELGEGDAGGGDDTGHAKDFGVFLVGDWADGEARILQEFDFAQGLVIAHFGEGYLTREALDGAKIDDELLFVGMVRIGIGIAADLGEGVDGMLPFAVIAERAVAFMGLLELAQRVRLVARVTPHLLTLHEKGVPMVDARINGQQPAAGLCRRLRHP